jgi:hypothetical protein
MATLRATVIIDKISGEPLDAIRNVWHFSTGGAIVAEDMTVVGNGLGSFYNALGGRLSNAVRRGSAVASVHRIEFAEVTRGGPGGVDDQVSTLLATRTFGILPGALSNTDYPSEVAACLSFRGDVTGVPEEAGLIRPKSRRRGRVYLGPFNSSVALRDPVSLALGFDPVVGAEIVNSYITNVIEAINGPSRIVNHIVYSPTSSLVHPVIFAHLDNAFDTMRSRGEVATGRSTAVVVQPALVP